MVLSESLKANLLGNDWSSQASRNESKQANVSRSGGSPLRRRVVIGLLIVAIILCAIVMLYKRQNNKLSCAKRLEDGACNVAHLHDYNFLLIAPDIGKLIRVQLNGEKTIVYSLTFKVHQIDHDCTEGRFYAISHETNQIYSANYNGTDEKLFIEEDTASLRDVAVDWISRRLYWADSGKGTIEVASLENPTVRTVLINKNLLPFSIAVDPLQRKLYWLNRWNTIEWSNLDGSERQILVSPTQISHVTSIKVSPSTGELCYLDRGLRRIQCINPVNKQIRTITSNLESASNLNGPYEFAISDELLYWADWNSDTIERFNSNGVRQEPISIPFRTYVIGITAVTDKCPLLYSPCARNNGDCPENTICLVNSSAPTGKSCIVKKKKLLTQTQSNAHNIIYKTMYK